MAVIALPDPSFNNYMIAPELVWGAVMNRRGTMVEASGRTGRRTAFRIQTSTTTLSNASPPESNMLGYSAGILILYCLQPPIAVNTDTELAITVMGRCLLQCLNPVPGYALFQTPIHHQGSTVAPGAAPAWVLEVDATNTNNTISDKWIGYHYGGAWLAGGYYTEWYNWGGNAPKYNSSSSGQSFEQSDGVSIWGRPLRMAVYTSDLTFPYWEDNDKSKKVPRYFVTFVNAIHHSVNIVGFQLLEHAMMQARGDTGMVPHGAELCLRYDKKPKWKEVYPESGGTRLAVKFFPVWQSDKPYPFGGPIYNTVNTCTAISTATYSTTNTMATAALTAPTSVTYSTAPFQPAPLVAPAPAPSQQYSSIPQPAPRSALHLPTPQASLPTPITPSSVSMNLPPTNVTSFYPSGTSSNPEVLLGALSAMQHQINTLISQMSSFTVEEDKGCSCPGACSCPALRHSEEHGGSLDISDDPLQISDNESDDTLAASDTEWDTDSTNTTAMQDHIAWVNQQQQQMQAAADRLQSIQTDYAIALAAQQQEEQATVVAPPLPTAPQTPSNWAHLIQLLRKRRTE